VYLCVFSDSETDNKLQLGEPDGLSLEKLYRAPTMWDEQRQVLGRKEGVA
jgi:hypothetical protein